MTRSNDLPFKILLGDDRSEYASAAVALLEDMPWPAGTDITVFRAHTPNQSTDLILIEAALNQICKCLKEKGLNAHAELQLGAASEKFLKYAEMQEPDLIMLGAQGLRATPGILVGGVAQQVVEYATCPVLVVRAPYNGLRNLLLVVDGSDSSRQALQFLGRLPLPAAAQLWVMHVLPPPPIPQMMILEAGMGLAPVALEDIQAYSALAAREMEQGQALVKQACEALQLMGKPARSILKTGDAATEIMAVAKQQKMDLLVSGSRGLSPIRSWLLGSVSRKLVHYSGCSVLVVRNEPVD